jgi:hypothetical protein
MVTVSIVLDALGNETSASFSLNFNSAVFSNPVVALGLGTPAGSVANTNVTEVSEGRLGILVDSVNPYAAGTRQIITVTFDVSADANLGLYPITFGGIPTPQSVANTTGGLLTTLYQTGIVQIGSTAAGVEVSGRVLTPDGRGLRNAVVTITDHLGNVRTATTSSFGYYRFEDIDTGSTFVVAVASKRYRFAPRLLQVFDTLANVDFVGLE